MANTTDQKIRLLALYDLLQSRTDEKHSLSTNEIIEALSARGITAVRKTIYKDIEVLNQYGYEVLCTRTKNNSYYVVNRKFERPEIGVLLSAVGSTQFLSNKKTLALMEKLLELLGIGEAEDVQGLFANSETKHSNERIYYNIDTIVTAINQKKKVSFLYFDYGINGNREYRRDRSRYIANPLGFVYSDDKLYLVCYHDNFDTATNYRIDRMDDVRLDKRDKAIKKEFEEFDLDAYRQEQFNMFGGEVQDITLIVPKELIEIIIDRFGEGIVPVSCSGGEYIIKIRVQISKTFFAWIATFEGKIKIQEPDRVKTDYAEFVKKIAENL